MQNSCDGRMQPVNLVFAPTPINPIRLESPWPLAQKVCLCRTEHMFFQGDRIQAVREMILADDEAGRRRALAKLLPMQREDFKSILEIMRSLPVTIRTLDPPLHEFLPKSEEEVRELAQVMGVPIKLLQEKVTVLQEIGRAHV